VLKGKIDSEYALFKNKIHRDLNDITGLKKIFSLTPLSELEKLHNLPEEEQFSQIYHRLESKNKTDAIKILKILSQEMDEIPLFRYYYYFSRNIQMPKEIEEMLRSSLTKRLLREEIEKRLINTCIDACPSCLQTRCDIDFDLRSRLLLSRRLLKYVISKIKQNSTINADNFFNVQQLKTEIIKCLEEKFEVYLQYSLNRSKDVAKIISDLISQVITKKDKKYKIYVNSSGYNKISLTNREVIYELCLRCKEVCE
jgi:hypothetical protein